MQAYRKLTIHQDPLLHARRVVAQRCLYGVDKNPFAVNLAKLSLWLATFAKDHPFTFVDHTLRCGDSLVGLTARQIEAFHWQPKEEGALLRDLPSRLRHILNARAQILDAADDTPYETLAQKLAVTDEQMIDLRLAGDLTVAAFFDADKPKERETQRKNLAEKFRRAQERVTDLDLEDELQGAVRVLKAGPKGVVPFHWELEFPEVFRLDERGKRAGGFDAFVGNPPFLGGTRISSVNSPRYLAFLTEAFLDSGNRMDLVAYFFRQAFILLRDIGKLGLIATNTIAQGDTRSGGLRYICNHGGSIYSARKRLTWPGKAAVVVSVVHISRGAVTCAKRLDDNVVGNITAFLVHQGGNEDPRPLAANRDICFEGFKPYSQGFLFDDADPEASPNSEMERALAENPLSEERVFPYLGGDEVNNSPIHAHRRYAINFGQLGEEEVSHWPELLNIVRRKVLPGRQVDYNAPWWQYFRPRPNLARRLSQVEHVLVCSRVQPHWTLARVPSRQVFAESLDVFTVSKFAAFAILQSRIHEIWARFFGSTLEDRLRYTPTDCFETFPFPASWETNVKLEAAGKFYYEFRAALMVQGNVGLTKTYNRFHDPNEPDPQIAKLRELHGAMDRAVLDAYGWTALQPRLDFILDFENTEDDESGSNDSKKPWRYRWVDEGRDEVLARLLELNRTRAEEEAQSEPATPTVKAAGKRGRKSTKLAPAASRNLFEVQGPTE